MTGLHPVACAVRYPDADEPPGAACPVCEDEPEAGARWTTREGHADRVVPEGGLDGIETEPGFGSGRRGALEEPSGV